jgi:predicted MFS family arabinose efflux permease
MGSTETAGGISGRLVVVLAVACGVAVANLYYSQPLLHAIASTFGAGSGTAGLIVTFSQIGYAFGLALVVPLGDLFNRRRLVPLALVGVSAALLACSVAPDIGVLIGLGVLVGGGSVIAQILVPLAAQLAPEAERGRVIGRVMSGMLLGILLARTLSGLIAGASSWRVVYGVAAGLTLTLAVVLGRALPAEVERPHLRYAALLGSTVAIFRAEALLRRRALFGALGFGAFSVLWTTIAFLLSGAPYRYGNAVIGLFGLVGAAGAICAIQAGRFADRGKTSLTTAIFAICIAVSFLPIWIGRHSLGWLIVGVVLLDLGVQGVQVTNQSLIYTLAPDARSRITSAYMVCYFIGGAIGSAVAGVVYDAGGWGGVCELGGGIGVALVGLWTFDHLRPIAHS